MIGRNHRVGKSQDSKALTPQPVVASRVGDFVMKRAIRLNDKSMAQANEVDDVRADWRLPPKPQVADLTSMWSSQSLASLDVGALRIRRARAR